MISRAGVVVDPPSWVSFKGYQGGETHFWPPFCSISHPEKIRILRVEYQKIDGPIALGRLISLF